MTRVAVALGCIVAATHYGYFLAPVELWETWFYVLRGVEGTALFLLLARVFHRHWPVVAVCLFGAVEEAQTALCGFVPPGDEPYGLCLQVAGPIPYSAAAATAIVYLIGSRKWSRSRKA